MEQLTSSARVSLDGWKASAPASAGTVAIAAIAIPAAAETNKQLANTQASLIEVWIDESERRTWFLTEINRDL